MERIGIHLEIDAQASAEAGAQAGAQAEAEIARLADEVCAGKRRALAKAITLVESRLPSDAARARRLVHRILPRTGSALRIGITGAPGAGKSTFIEAFGQMIIAEGKKIAALAIDPSSERTGGSILGDKTRMIELSRSDSAFIRPSPAGETLGGVARRTRETMLLCEAAGFDVIVVETVGVGQSETAVASMVDFFLVLALAGAGDELQGMKRGIMELADAIAVNKAEEPNRAAAERAAQHIRNGLHYAAPKYEDWSVPTLLCSALEKTGVAEIWATALEFSRSNPARIERLRARQSVQWMRENIEEGVRSIIAQNPALAAFRGQLEQEVRAQRLLPSVAAEEFLRSLRQALASNPSASNA